MRILTKRIYEKPSRSDGLRVLVDRLWPRGLKKEDAAVDHWIRDVAPSAALRRWFGHAPERWDEFKKRYVRELNRSPGPCQALMQTARGRKKGGTATVTLLFAAKDEKHNNAVALKEYLERNF